MRLRTVFRWTVFTVLASALLHVLTVAILPWVVMSRVYDTTGETWGYNRVTHVRQIDAETRFVPRPDPSMAYSVCPFDLADGPVRLAHGALSGLVSVTAYGAANQNFLTRAGDGLPAETLVIATEAQAEDLPGPAVTSPGEKGVVLIRWLVRSPDDWRTVETERTTISCGPAL